MEDNREPINIDTDAIVKEKIDEVLKHMYEDKEPLAKRHEWKEDGQLYYSWHVTIPGSDGSRGASMYTNDAGMKQINDSIKTLIEKEYGTTTE